MNEKETAAVMALFRTAYPRYYAGLGEEETRSAVALWHKMLEGYEAAEVGMAVKAIIATNKFPPTVAEVIEQLNELRRGGEMGELEAWGYISRALRNAAYHAQEEWEALPEELQRAVSPDLLHSWAMVDGEDAETVIQSNFMRTFRAMQARRKKQEALPGNVRAFLEQREEYKRIGGGYAVQKARG